MHSCRLCPILRATYIFLTTDRLLMRTASLFLTILFVFGFYTAAGQSGDSWSVDDIVQQESITNTAIHPDGSQILWTKRYPDADADQFKTDLQLTFLDDPHGDEDPATISLTQSGDNSNPAWRPDGQQIAFMSSRDVPNAPEAGGRQIWTLDPRGGAPTPLTSLENGVQSMEWLDEERILFSAREDKTHHEEALEQAQDGTQVVEDTTLYHPVRLFTLDVESESIERVTENDARVTEFEPDPSGRYVVYSINPTPVDVDAQDLPEQYLLDLATGETTKIFDEPYFNPSGFQWALDGSGFFASWTYSSDPENAGAGIQQLYHYDVGEEDYEQVPLDADNYGIGAGGYAVTDDGIHVQIADKTQMEPRFYTRDGGEWTYEIIDDERLRHSTSLGIGPDGETMLFNPSRADEPPTYLVGSYQQGNIDGETEWVSINDFLGDREIPQAEVIEWEGAEGATINGILYYPLDYDPDQSYPLITVIHGGPSAVDLDAWRFDWTVYPGLWAERGAFVFRPNYHGSGHHELDFIESIKGRYYELELPDMVKGIDHLAEQGKVDRDSLGVMGWSNGGILTTALTVEYPDLFEAAAPGAGNVNWTSDYGNSQIGVRFNDSYFQGPPWAYTDHYVEKSPFFRLDEVRTPTIIPFGAEDRIVPTEQGWQHYRALEQVDEAPVRYLLFPGEGHGLSQISHQKRKVEEELEWFDTYLWGERSMEERVAERVVAENAPLTRLERKRDIARTNGQYGTTNDDTLLPETVTVDDTLHVGRFEVTRAQYAAYDSDYEVEPGTENHPVSGLSADEAEAYVEWLSETTGESYRLPTEAEAARLQSMAGPDENNLAYWAGYTPTPDERDELDNWLEDATADELLMPAGSRPPGNASNEQAPLLYDLDGNVAEWTATDDGHRAMNSSAVTIRDGKAPEQATPPSEFIGFRVVKDAP